MSETVRSNAATDLDSVRTNARDMLRAGRLRDAFSDLAKIVEAVPATQESIFLADRAFKSEKRVDHIALMFSAAMLQMGDTETATMLFQIARPNLAADMQILAGTPYPDLREFCTARGYPVFATPAYNLELMMRASAAPPVESFVACLPKGRVVGQSWIPASADGNIFINQISYNALRAFHYAECDRYDGIAVPARSNYLLRAGRSSSRGPAVLLGQNHNFGHWLLNHAGRLALIEDHPELEALPVIIGTESSRARAALETLERLGINHDRIIQVEPGELAEFEQLWVPSQLFCLLTTPAISWSPRVLDFLRRRLGVGEPKPGRRRLYLTRRSARYRKLQNEAAVFALLEPLGFEMLDVGALSLAEQIEVAGDVAAIVGPAGNALNLALFAARGVPVIELGYPELSMRASGGLSHALSQPFVSIDGQLVAGDRSDIESDFIIDPEIVLLTVRSAVEAL